MQEVEWGGVERRLSSPHANAAPLVFPSPARRAGRGGSAKHGKALTSNSVSAVR